MSSYVGASTTTGYTNEASGYPQTYMANDILALQTMYGANFAIESGNGLNLEPDRAGVHQHKQVSGPGIAALNEPSLQADRRPSARRRAER